MIDNIKNKLRKISLLYSINARWKAKLYKQSYATLKKYYDRLDSLNDISCSEDKVSAQVKALLVQRGIYPKIMPKGKLRIIYVGTDPQQDFGGIIQGLQKYGEVIFFEQESGIYGQKLPNAKEKDISQHNGRRLIEIVKNAQKVGPVNVVIGQMWAFSMDSSALQKVRETGIPVVNISMDDRHAFRIKKINGKWTGTSGLIGAIDIACTTAKECCLWYELEGCPAVYLPEASDPEFFKPLSVPKEHDVCFVGANYGVRSKIVKAIEKKNVKVTCYGNGWQNGRIDVKKLPELFAKSRIILGVGTIGYCTDFYALKMRDFDGPMSGSLYLTHDNTDLYELYEVGKEIITYKTPEECAQKIRYYLDHPEERETIARAGRIRAEREHTWEKRFEKIFRTIGLIVD